MFGWLFGSSSKSGTPRPKKSYYWKVTLLLDRLNSNRYYGYQDVVVNAADRGSALAEAVEQLRETYPAKDGWIFKNMEVNSV